MDRRAFIGTLTGSLLAAPLAAKAQSPAARIGLLGPAEEPRFSEITSGLKQGIREQGYRDNTIHVVEGRTQRGDEAGARADGRCRRRGRHARARLRARRGGLQADRLGARLHRARALPPGVIVAGRSVQIVDADARVAPSVVSTSVRC